MSRFAPPPTKKQKNPIGSFRHMVTLCTADDIVLDGATIVLARRKAIDVRAAIKEDKGSTWSRDGFAVKEPRDTPTHCITIRYRGDHFSITSTAWIYEKRAAAPPRWWKVIKVSETEEQGIYPWNWDLKCRLVEKSDYAPAPQASASVAQSPAPAAKLPPGVRL